MVNYLTIGVLSARSRARVLAFITQARSVRGAIGIQHAFGSTAFVGISKVFRQTGASAGAVLLSAHRVRSARRRRARRRSLFANGIRRTYETLHERIARVAYGAYAHRRVAHDAALGVRAARSRTRVFALLIYARQIAGALAVTDAFRPTIGRRADKFGEARARGRVADLPALGIRSARRRLTGVHWHRGGIGCGRQSTTTDWYTHRKGGQILYIRIQVMFKFIF